MIACLCVILRWGCGTSGARRCLIFLHECGPRNTNYGASEKRNCKPQIRFIHLMLKGLPPTKKETPPSVTFNVGGVNAVGIDPIDKTVNLKVSTDRLSVIRKGKCGQTHTDSTGLTCLATPLA